MTKQRQQIIAAINAVEPSQRTEAQLSLLDSIQRFDEWTAEGERLKKELGEISAQKVAFIDAMIKAGLFTRVSAKKITFGSCDEAKAAVKKFKKLRLAETRAKRHIKEIHGSLGGCIVLGGSYAAAKVAKELGLNI